MNIEPTKDLSSQVDAMVKRLRILWFALCMSVAIYYVFTVFVGREEASEPNDALFLILLGMALSATMLAFVVKSKQLSKAAAERNIQMVFQAYILTLAITEAGALLGVVAFFIAHSTYYFVFFIIAGLAYLLHFPRREHVESATFKEISL